MSGEAEILKDYQVAMMTVDQLKLDAGNLVHAWGNLPLREVHAIADRIERAAEVIEWAARRAAKEPR